MRGAPDPVRLGGRRPAFFDPAVVVVVQHLGFALAYLISASACVLLIGFYVCHVLRSVAHGLGFFGRAGGVVWLAVRVAQCQDYALLMGSPSPFGLSGTVMVLTRKLDWYGRGKRKVGARAMIGLREDQQMKAKMVNFSTNATFHGRSELAREERKNTAFNQTTRVIVDDFREQARSYRGG